MYTIIPPSGYSITEQIYESSRTQVYRGQRLSDRKPVVIKILKSEYPSFKELVLFRNQYTIAKNLNFPGIIKTYSLENYHNGYALVMEDFGGISLMEWFKESKIDSANLKSDFLSDFFTIALQIVNTLEELYRNRVIHKDIKPANILIHPISKQIRLIDFSIASLLPKETQILTSPNVLEGTLAYLSPEQTGRMNRGIDYRSDFYSLGVTFFQLLTGELPFNSNDLMELVHSHIAKIPPTVHIINPKIPSIISEIVNKLMAKNAENRYQSALGIKYDLENCLHQWKNHTNITSFDLGTRDICDRFIIPEKLYGRETEVKALLNAFERVSGANQNKIENQTQSPKSQAEMILVAGFSGIGKTAVVNEVHKPIVRQRGYFIKGKFDQFQRNVPLSAFVQAFRDLTEQLLAENEVKIRQWKTQILQVVGDIGQVIIEVIPELEKIIGKQPAIPELSGTASQNRFNLIFQKFIQIFTTKEHPLVIFLDDLQWADSISLKLIQLLMSGANSNHLLFIGAYRDNEVFPGHPLMLILEEIKKASATINTITLKPLSLFDINHLIADTLNCPEEVTLQLTEIIYDKTEGNPFFTTQLLKVLYEDNLIYFDLNLGYWQCDTAKIRANYLSNDVVGFMTDQLTKLPESTQKVLQLASCVGNQFDLNTLATVYQKPVAETAVELWKALQEGYIIPQSEIYKLYQDEFAISNPFSVESENQKQGVTYRFLHDRVQQAAYSLIPCDRKQSTHLQIGQLLLQNIPISEREERIFEIVNHLNIGIDLITLASNRDELTHLNLLAGIKAINSTAYTAALDYFSIGISLLKTDSWQTKYELTNQLYEEAADAAYLAGEFQRMEQLVQIVLEQAKTPLNKVKVYNAKIQAFGAQGKAIEAVDIALTCLKLLDIDLPQNPTQSDVHQEMEKISAELADKPIEDLISLPEMTEAKYLAGMRILSSIATLAFQATPNLFILMTLKQIELSIKYGNAPWSAFAYVVYGFILCVQKKDIKSGYQLGKLGINLLTKFSTKEVRAKVIQTFYANIQHWQGHAKKALKPQLEAYSAGLETGDLEFAAFALVFYCSSSYWIGKELQLLQEEMETYSHAIQQIKQDRIFIYNEIYHQAVLNLLGEVETPCRLIGVAFNEDKILPLHHQLNDGITLLNTYSCKLQLCYLFGEYSQAIENAVKAENYLHGGLGNMVFLEFHFYYSLALLAVYPEIEESAQTQILEQVSSYQEKMQSWAHHAPMNNLHKFYLVEAERYRVLGKNLEAMELYDLAIAGAKENDYIHEEALANELAAKFYLQSGRKKIAQVYMTDAYYGYAHWGAKAKVDDLTKHYPQLLVTIFRQDKKTFKTNETISLTSTTVHSTNTTVKSLLDLGTVMKASQVISEEIQHDKLLATFMQVVLENAGASKCVLILQESGEWFVKATCSSLENEVNILQSISLEKSVDVPNSLINYLARIPQTIVIDDVTSIARKNKFVFLDKDPYILQGHLKSLMCTPVINQGNLIGIIYLENSLTIGAFTDERVEILKLLCSQAAISLENSRLYQQAQDYAKQLEFSLSDLQQTQLQLVQSEKMSALGNLVAGIAHEINNPVGFITGNLQPAREYIRDLLGLIDLYQYHYPNPVAEITKEIDSIDLEYVREDLPKLINSMREGVNRIYDVSMSLRTFSRADTQKQTASNIHETIDSTILILKHRLKASETRPEIEIVKDYGDLPLINCFPGQLGQVFMNLLANAIDALEESNGGRTFNEIKVNPNRVEVITRIGQDSKHVLIRIKDNGMGMPEEVKQKIFDHLFTTKAVGKGTGLGLSIARQIVEEKHAGKIQCFSKLGQGTEFIIEIPLDK